ncbi:MAG: oligosaccharide flippase family protein [Candidatus Micrarchaeota archaeon]|nr:oligosaccharide flippase family protein [Candidatus Micrarchaeota archaeon]
MEEVRTLAKGYLWETFFTFLSKLSSFVYSVIIAYLFLKDQIGIFYYTLSVIFIISTFKDFGISSALARHVPYLSSRKEWGYLFRVVKISYVVGILISLLIFAVVVSNAGLISSLLKNEELSFTLIPLAGFILLVEILDLNRAFLRGVFNFREAAFFEFLQNASKLLLTLIFYVLFGKTTVALIYAFVISYIPSVLLGMIIFHKKFTELINKHSGEASVNNESLSVSLKLLFSFGITVVIVNSLLMIQQSTDKIMYLYFFPSDFYSLGIFSIMQTLSSVIYIVPSGLGVVLLPLLSKLYGGYEKEKIKNILKVSFGWIILLTIPVIALMLVFSESIISLFYGKSYLEGNTWLVTLVMANFLLILSLPFNYYLIASRRLKLELAFVLLSALSNVIFNFYFIPIYGLFGAALGSLFSALVTLIVFLIFVYHDISFRLDYIHFFYFILFFVLLSILLFTKGITLSIIDNIIVYFEQHFINSLNDLLRVLARKSIQLIAFGTILVVSYLLVFSLVISLKAYHSEISTVIPLFIEKASNKKKTILFLGTGFHYAHMDIIIELKKEFDIEVIQYRPAKRTDNLFLKLIGMIKGILFLPKADVYITESNFYYPVLYSLLFFWQKKPTIININASPLFFELINSSNSIIRKIFIFLIGRVDCHICVGQFYKEILENQANYKGKIIVYYPKIKKELINQINFNDNPQNRPFNICTIASGDPYFKGLDITIKVHQLLLNDYPDIKLFIIGRFNSDFFIDSLVKNSKNVYVMGYIDKPHGIVDIFKQCTFYLHPGRGDPFALSIIEAMSCSLIPITNTITGSSEIVKKIDEELVMSKSADITDYKLLIQKLISDRRRIDELIIKSRQIQKDYGNFSCSNFETTIKLINEIIKSGNNGI